MERLTTFIRKSRKRIIFFSIHSIRLTTVVKIRLSLALSIFDYCQYNYFPNQTQLCVITYTNYVYIWIIPSIIYSRETMQISSHSQNQYSHISFQQIILAQNFTYKHTRQFVIPSNYHASLSSYQLFIMLFQIVWADTTHVGCGIAKCSSVVNVLLPPGFDADLDLLFCNYGPA